MAFDPNIYEVPPGQDFGSSPVERLDPGVPDGLDGREGVLFFSPSLTETNGDNGIDVASIGVSAFASDLYVRPQERSSRLFRFGGGPGFGASNPSRTNATLYRSQPLEYTVIAVLVQTIPPGPTTVIRIP